jgi:hypothetical protein
MYSWVIGNQITWFKVDIDSARVNAGNAADVSAILTASIFTVGVGM